MAKNEQQEKIYNRRKGIKKHLSSCQARLDRIWAWGVKFGSSFLTLKTNPSPGHATTSTQISRNLSKTFGKFEFDGLVVVLGTLDD